METQFFFIQGKTQCIIINFFIFKFFFSIIYEIFTLPKSFITLQYVMHFSFFYIIDDNVMLPSFIFYKKTKNLYEKCSVYNVLLNVYYIFSFLFLYVMYHFDELNDFFLCLN